MMSQPVLTLSNVSYAYRDQTPALAGVSLALFKGERVALLGANGAGKSTMFLLCNGVLTPDSGELLLDGKPVGKRDAGLRLLRQSVGLVFQNPDDQLIGATVRSEISFGPMNLDLPEDAVRTAVAESSAAMNLEAMLDKPPQYLSGGEKKRVSIADILAMRARVILFDEPTASLDPAHTALLEQTLEKLHQDGLCLLVSTHDVNFAWRWADRAVVLSKGHILRDGPICEVFADGALLREAGLHKPELFAAAELLFPGMPCAGYPRTIDAFQAMLQENLP